MQFIYNKIGTKNNFADMMTKPMTTNKFRHFLDLVGILLVSEVEPFGAFWQRQTRA